MDYNKSLNFKFPGHQKSWDNLIDLWTSSSVKFYLDQSHLQWVIEESIDFVPTFRMERSVLTLDRRTVQDCYGLLGLSLLNLSKRSVILTEGVSDFFTAKLQNPSFNVLGVTTLGGSQNARALLLSLFDTFTICSDSDPTGITNAFRWRKFLKDYNKEVSIYIPDSPHKDITEEFLSALQFQSL